MKWNFSPVALFSFRRLHWLRGLRRALRHWVGRPARAKDEARERRARLELLVLERRESVGGDCSPMGVWLAASGMVGAVALKSLVDSFLAPAGPSVRDVSALPTERNAAFSSLAPSPWMAEGWGGGEQAPTMCWEAPVAQSNPSRQAALDAFFAQSNARAASTDNDMSDDLPSQNTDADRTDDAGWPLGGQGGGGDGSSAGGYGAGPDSPGMLDAAGGGLNPNAAAEENAHFLTESLGAQSPGLPNLATPAANLAADAAAAAGVRGVPAPTLQAQTASGFSNTPIQVATGFSGTSAAANSLVFLASQGTAAAQFQSQAPGFNVSLGSSGATFAVNGPAGSSQTVQMQFVGGNAGAPLSGVDATQGQAFAGMTPAQLHAPAFASVSASPYQGINVSYYANQQGQLEYNVTVAPGANPGQFLTSFQGASQLSLDAQGNLQIATSQSGVGLVESAPSVYQMVNGVQTAVASHYTISGQQVGIALGAYNPSLPLVIDPVLTASNGSLYGSPSTSPAGSTPDSAGTLPLDNGTTLLLIANFYGNSVSVLQSNGNGSFTSLGSLPTGNGPNGFAVGDFGNGHQDFAIANYDDNTVSVYMGDGTGHFTAGPTLSTGAGPANEMAIGDFTGNGKLDLATANMNDGTVSVFMGNANGTFQPAVRYNVGVGAICITSGDFTGNGLTDLAVGNYDNSTVTVLTNQGNGTFTVGSPMAVGANPWYIASGDFTGAPVANAFGAPVDDLATANFGSGTVSVLLSNGSAGTWQTPVSYTVGANPTGIVAGDVTGTGAVDLVTSNYGSNSASVLLGTGDGRFLPAEDFAAGSGGNGLALADFTDDGKLDIAIADQNGNDASVLLNTTLQGVEGHAFSGVIGSFSDATSNPPLSSFTASVDWGDGSPLDTTAAITADPNGGFDVNGSHTYAEEGTYLLQIYVRDASGNETTISNTVYVADAPLTVSAATLSGTVTSGQTFTGVVGSFTDADPNGQPGDYVATVNWGDGTPADSNTSIVANGSGGFNIIGTHTYGASGTFAIQVAVQDGDPERASSSGSITVAAPGGGSGTVTLNGLVNGTTLLVSANDGQGDSISNDNVYASQFNLTYTAAAGGATNFVGFCVDVFHTVTVGQTYAVNARADLSTAFTNGAAMAYLEQTEGMQSYAGNDDGAAALQIALWDESLDNHTPTEFVQDSDGSVTAFDGVGNVTSVTDADGNKTTYTYDKDNRQISMTDPLGNTETYTYDKVGNLISRTDRDGRITNNTYDYDNRLTKTVWLASDGVTVTDTKTYSYDKVGNLLTATNNAGTYTMTYDADDRMITQTDPFGLTITYGYDGNGNVVSEQDSAGGLTTYAYDADNRETREQFTDGSTQFRVDSTYDRDGNILTQTRYADLARTELVGETVNTYDADDRVTSIVDKDASGIVTEDFRTSYDAGSRVTAETDNGVTTNYTYDADNELLSDGTNTYTYDANGNRTSENGVNYTIGRDNQLLSDGTWVYHYDNEGNLTGQVAISDSSDTVAYSYNNANQMTLVVDEAPAGTTQEAVTYDVFGNRLTQTVTNSSGTTTTEFAYDNAGDGSPNIWADLDASGSVTTRRIFGAGVNEPLARITVSSGTVAWYLTDRQGSIRGITDDSGNLQDQITYDSFGNVVSEANSSFGDRYKYTGAQVDPVTGLQEDGARLYNSDTGSWTTQDPLGLAPGPNPYEYVSNGPTNASDPSGLLGTVGTPSNPFVWVIDDKINEVATFYLAKSADDIPMFLRGLNYGPRKVTDLGPFVRGGQVGLQLVVVAIELIGCPLEKFEVHRYISRTASYSKFEDKEKLGQVGGGFKGKGYLIGANASDDTPKNGEGIILKRTKDGSTAVLLIADAPGTGKFEKDIGANGTVMCNLSGTARLR